MAGFRTISLRHPRPHDVVDDPVEIAGVGTGFEGTLNARLRDGKGRELAQRHFQAGGTGIWGNFFLRLDLPEVPRTPQGVLEVFEVSAEDGSETPKVVRPIVFGRALRDPYLGFAVHRVVSGETLRSIAEQWYGDPAAFRILFQANRDRLTDPDLIVVGQQLRVPQ